MVKYAELELDEVFGALSSSPRRQVLNMLLARSMTMSELAVPLKLSLPALHKHIKILQRAKLIEQRKYGRSNIITFQPRALLNAEQWSELHKKFWTEQLDSLEHYLDNQKKGK